MKKILLVTLIFMQSLYAVVTIAPAEIGGKSGFSGEVSTSLNTQKGNTEKQAYTGSTKIIYDEAKEYLTWIELSAEYAESSQIKDTNKLYSHLRYIHTTDTQNLNYEIFAQLQTDEFQLISNRTLLGGGARYKFTDLIQNDKLFFGLGGFYEHIDYSSEDKTENNERVNIYLAYTINIQKSLNISYNVYFQPLINNFADHVNYHTLELKTKLYEQLSMKFQMEYSIDSEPPKDTKGVNFSQTTALSYDF